MEKVSENPFKRSRLDDFDESNFSVSPEQFEDQFWEAVIPLASSMSASVTFLGIDEGTTFYKYQSRVKKEAKQRLKNAVVEILVTTGHQIKRVDAWIQREEKATELFGYDVGRVQFKNRDIVYKGTNYLENNNCISEHLYSIDLDSVYYDSPLTRRPVYKLAKTDMLNRNRFQLIIQLIFIDETVSQDFISPPFFCQTQSKSNLSKRSRAVQNVCQFPRNPRTSDLFERNVGIKMLHADDAVIGKLVVKEHFSGPKKKADIAYSFLTDPKFQKSLNEGDVVGIQVKFGQEAYITQLTSANANKIVQVGVISRSAFFEGNIPSDEANKTDKICILGLVNVKIVGKVRNGECVYASTRYPGKAISGSHPFRSEDDLLLGMAMYDTEEDSEREHLVQCFVSFLFGISSKYFRDKTNELTLNTIKHFEDSLSKGWKEMQWTIMGFCAFLILFTALACLLVVVVHTSA